MGKDRSGKRLRREAEERRLADIARCADFARREAIFLDAFQALCLEHGLKLVAHANPSNNISCDPEIEVNWLDDRTDRIEQIREYIKV
jgi:hypothetical protein